MLKLKPAAILYTVTDIFHKSELKTIKNIISVARIVDMAIVILGARIKVTKRYKVRVCSRLFAGTAGSNPARGMDVCLLRVLCVVR